MSRPVRAAAVGIAVLFVILVIFGFSTAASRLNTAPEQPIPFSHSFHVSDLGLTCVFCHRNVIAGKAVGIPPIDVPEVGTVPAAQVEVAGISPLDRGQAAGLPPVALCMFCHAVVGTGNSEIEELRTYAANQQPIVWNRVYRLPDVVRFTHQPHIDARIDCSACHGEVERMALVRSAGPLGMPECVSCHRERGAPTDCSFCHY